MEPNVGKTDQIIRIFVGLVLLALGGFLFLTNPNSTFIPIILVFFAIISLGTAVTRICMLYKPFGIKTCSD